MNSTEYRQSSAEQQRSDDLLGLMPTFGKTALDIGARDGCYSLLLAERFEKVISLDLVKPTISHPRVQCMEGNVISLEFSTRSIEFVFCAEVLEHIPKSLLRTACREIERVSNGQILIGVPYRQDIRVGRTTCSSCKGKNPPWGHINTFDEITIAELFPASNLESITFVGTNYEQTNILSSVLMDLAGNPYGTYSQDEPCIHCGCALTQPSERNIVQKLLTKVAHWSRYPSNAIAKPRANWMHVLLSNKNET